VRKRLNLDLASVVVDGVRCYRITGDDAAKSIETKPVGRKS
jgi:hypothetical protein